MKLTAPLSLRLLDRESNRVNAGLLVGHIVVGILVAFFLLGFQVREVVPAVLLVLALGVTCAYDYIVLSKIELLRR